MEGDEFENNSFKKASTLLQTSELLVTKGTLDHIEPSYFKTKPLS